MLKILKYFSLVLLLIIFLFPFFWMVVSSFKPTSEVLAIPVNILPKNWQIDAYTNLSNYTEYDFTRYFINSFVVTFFAVLLAVILCTTAGYGFAKYKFKYNNLIFIIVLSTIMIPFQAIVVPLFILMRDLGLQNSYLGLIIPESLTAFGIFLMRQFFYSIPDEIIESARIEGASEFRIFWSISLPLAKTAIFALVIFHSQWVWNLLLWPLIIISSPEMRTIPQAIALFSGVYFTPYPEQLAISVLACLPLLVIFMFLSKNFVKGITLTGLK